MDSCPDRNHPVTYTSIFPFILDNLVLRWSHLLARTREGKNLCNILYGNTPFLNGVTTLPQQGFTQSSNHPVSRAAASDVGAKKQIPAVFV